MGRRRFGPRWSSGTRKPARSGLLPSTDLRRAAWRSRSLSRRADPCSSSSAARHGPMRSRPCRPVPTSWSAMDGPCCWLSATASTSWNARAPYEPRCGSRESPASHPGRGLECRVRAPSRRAVPRRPPAPPVLDGGPRCRRPLLLGHRTVPQDLHAAPGMAGRRPARSPRSGQPVGDRRGMAQRCGPRGDHEQLAQSPRR